MSRRTGGRAWRPAAACAAALVLPLFACASCPPPPADVVYFGGPILTMETLEPRADFVAVRGGRIQSVGRADEMPVFVGPETRRVDLAGRTLMPGLVDAHSHLVMTAAKLAVVNADPPPAGGADGIAAIQRALREALAAGAHLETGGWLVGWGYDHAQLAEARHPDRRDLDAVSDEVPIALIHFSSHQVVVNGAGLARAGVDAASEDPPGGRILRFPGSDEPNGLLQESAMFPVVFPLLDALQGGGPGVDLTAPPADAALARVEAALGRYVAEGFTTVTEMAATPLALRLLRALAEGERLPVDVFAAPLSQAFTPEQVRAAYAPAYHRRFRVGGAKIVLDGGSPGRSAHLLEPYHVQAPGESGYRGFSHFASQADLDALVTAHFHARTPVYLHALGDAAVREAIAALRAAHAAVPGARRGHPAHPRPAGSRRAARGARRAGGAGLLPGRPQLLLR